MFRRRDSCSRGCAPAGFPKTVDNLELFEEQCGACAAAIVLEASEEVLTARLLERGKTSQRTDDTPEAISRRYRTFQLQCVTQLPQPQTECALTERVCLAIVAGRCRSLRGSRKKVWCTQSTRPERATMYSVQYVPSTNV